MTSSQQRRDSTSSPAAMTAPFRRPVPQGPLTLGVSWDLLNETLQERNRAVDEGQHWRTQANQHSQPTYITRCRATTITSAHLIPRFRKQQAWAEEEESLLTELLRVRMERHNSEFYSYPYKFIMTQTQYGRQQNPPAHWSLQHQRPPFPSHPDHRAPPGRCAWCNDPLTPDHHSTCWVGHPQQAEEHGMAEYRPPAMSRNKWLSSCARTGWWPPSMRAAKNALDHPAAPPSASHATTSGVHSTTQPHRATYQELRTHRQHCVYCKEEGPEIGCPSFRQALASRRSGPLPQWPPSWAPTLPVRRAYMAGVLNDTPTPAPISNWNSQRGTSALAIHTRTCSHCFQGLDYMDCTTFRSEYPDERASMQFMRAMKKIPTPERASHPLKTPFPQTRKAQSSLHSTLAPQPGWLQLTPTCSEFSTDTEWEEADSSGTDMEGVTPSHAPPASLPPFGPQSPCALCGDTCAEDNLPLHQPVVQSQ